jgi:ribosomal protein S18 acetylase RimI-like enzyme
MPVVGDTSLMRYPLPSPPIRKNPRVQVQEIPKSGRLLEHWIDVVGGNDEDAEKWKRVARAEALFPATRLYMGFLEGMPVGTCSLISGLGWGRIESVATLPLFRRMGVGTSLVCKAIADSMMAGDAATYLFTEAGGMGEALYKDMGFEIIAKNALRRHLE